MSYGRPNSSHNVSARFMELNDQMKQNAAYSDMQKELKKNPVGMFERQRGAVQYPLEKQLIGLAQTTPRWLRKIDKNYVENSGEAPIFSEKFLTSHKMVQNEGKSNVLSPNISKSRRRFANNADLYCQSHRTKNYLLASKMPDDGAEYRQTRGSRLRDTYREQLQPAACYNSARIVHKRKKEKKPVPPPLQRWMPTKYQMYDCPHSFLVGTRYTSSTKADLKAFNRVGLYLARARPAASFLTIYRGTDHPHNAESIDENYAIPHPSQRSSVYHPRTDNNLNHLIKSCLQSTPSTHHHGVTFRSKQPLCSATIAPVHKNPIICSL